MQKAGQPRLAPTWKSHLVKAAGYLSVSLAAGGDAHTEHTDNTTRRAQRERCPVRSVLARCVPSRPKRQHKLVTEAQASQ